MMRALPLLILALCGTATAAPAETLRPYTPVTDARLLQPEPGNWLLYRGNYAGWGYSSLAKLTSKNVGRLELAWSYATGMNEGHQAPPLVNDGYLYVSTPNNQVLAFDARTGRELWRYRKSIPDDLLQLHPTNRGVALYGDAVYVATTDAHLVCLDAVTGKLRWSKAVGDWKAGYYMTLAPLAVDGKIIVGVSGGELGVRGFIAALDAVSGEERWRTHTIPGPGEPGYDTWPEGAAATGGGSVWITGTYDPDTRLTFWGIGNASPWTPYSRQGDNLYSNSVLALDVGTGALKGYHQYHWNDSWDWDEVSAPLLIDLPGKDGNKKLNSLVHAGRNGYLWILERTEAKVNFVEAWPYVMQNVFTSVDPKTGRPAYEPSRIMRPDGKAVSFCPSVWGGKDWPPEAYSPKTGLFYIPANNNLCSELTPIPAEYKKGELFIGVALDNILSNIRMTPEAQHHIGEIQAWNLSSRKKAWTHEFPAMNWGPLLVTAGNLLFAGGTNDRKFRAFDATTGKVLWEFPASSGVTGVPSTFEIDGEQYVAVQSGWGVDAQRMQGAFDATLGTKTVVPAGGTVLVFRLRR
jgi:alcohol dehydrogenase (cytochrome c)